ncbi:MAG: phosphoribosylamine--glycine ligase [Bdellovibrionaceae bacterium]|nr:phosphoribosylamine--glycine ligase [Pseudobdellovibrionaceae bacterium]
MNVAVIGSGGREHALVKALVKSESVNEVHAYPGSVGIAQLAQCHAISWNPSTPLIKSLKDQKIDLVVVGPEAPLAEGLGNTLREAGFLVFGPDQAAAQLEGSKIFCKEFLVDAGIPTADYKILNSYEHALELDFDFPFVIKADGLASGKGVYICKTKEDVQKAAYDIFKRRIFGETQALAEKFLKGWELSYIIITDGTRYEVCPLAQDHKTLCDGGEGPNTGGMGVLGPIQISEDLDQKIRRNIVEPTLKTLNDKNLPYRGALFIGLMIQDDEPYVLEYNVRFGDPETQIIMPLIEGDMGLLLRSCAQGELQGFKVRPQHAACVVLAAKGYPDNPEKGAPISGDILTESEDSYFIYAGVGRNPSGEFFVSGGRVLGAVGIAATKDEAIEKAYHRLGQVNWDGIQYRKDIGRYFTF